MVTMGSFWFLLTILATLIVDCCNANIHATKLYLHLMSGYNRLIRPVQNSSDKVTVKVKLKLSQLVDVNEKNQMMTTSIWLKQVWTDENLVWNVTEYGGVSSLYIPSDQIWVPDIVLYNNADGKYQVSLMTKAAVYSNGTVVWQPPALYKSMCPIDIEFFPFDTQNCEMRFGSWTYDGVEVDLIHYDQDKVQHGSYTVGPNAGLNYTVVMDAVDLTDYYQSGEFDIMTTPAKRHEQYFQCCNAPFVDITYMITLRRQTLFYTINLVLPCVGLAFLCILVFYLPSACGEKVALSISILICLTMFFLLLVEIIPSTSLEIPLIGKYLLFTMVMVTMSIAVTVIQLNFHYRSPNTHYLSPFMRKIFLDILPKLLMMRRPAKYNDEQNGSKKSENEQKKVKKDGRKMSKSDTLGTNMNAGSTTDLALAVIPRRSLSKEINAVDSFAFGQLATTTSLRLKSEQFEDDATTFRTAVRSACFIADYLKRQTDDDDVKEDWQFIACVFDRLFLWIFSIGCFGGTMAILINRKSSVFDYNKAIA